MRLRAEEPAAGPWRAVQLREVFEQGLSIGAAPGMAIIAIDGRSSSGKTSLAGRAAALFPNSSVVHTDDIAWHYSAFEWAQLLAEGVLEPARAGRPVSYRPPSWDVRGRAGSVKVPSDTRLLLVEGVGASRRGLRGWLDGAVWMQTDLDETLARDRVRVAAGEISQKEYEGWMAEEAKFLARERPWERADLVICGSSGVAVGAGEVLVASAPPG